MCAYVCGMRERGRAQSVGEEAERKGAGQDG